MVKQKKEMRQYKGYSRVCYVLHLESRIPMFYWSIVAHHLTPSRSVPSTNVRKMKLSFWYFGAVVSIAMARKVVLTACHHTDIFRVIENAHAKGDDGACLARGLTQMDTMPPSELTVRRV